MESITTYLLLCCAMSGHVTMPAQWSKWVNIFDALYPLWVDIDVWLNCTRPPCFIQFVNFSNPNISRNFHLLGCFFGDCLGLEAFDHGPQSGCTSTAGRIGTVCPRFYDFFDKLAKSLKSGHNLNTTLWFSTDFLRVRYLIWGIYYFWQRGLGKCLQLVIIDHKSSHTCHSMQNWTETTAFLKVVDALCL